MRKIQIKIILLLLLITFFTLTIPRVIFQMVYEESIEELDWGSVYLIGALISGGLFVIFANISLNFMIVKRIRRLNLATKNITDGNFNESVVVYGHDEISELTHHFNVMTTALRDNYYVNQSFMKDYAHEFQTPISVIKGYADLIASSNDINEMKDYASIISKQSQGLSQLSQNILELSLLENEQVVRKDDHYDVSNQIREIIQVMQPKWEEKQLDLDIKLHHLEISGNEKFSYLMFRNLIDNAIKYAYDQSILSIILSVKDENVYISISNQGDKILENDLNKIFDIFYRSDKSKASYGHGVGLSIVKKIVDKLDYDINVESSNEKTTFCVKMKTSK